MAPLLNSLASLLRSNSPDHNAKGTQSVVTEASPCPTSYRLYASRFRISFTPRTGVLFTFPSRYSFTIGQQVVLSLGGWSPQIPNGFHVPGGTWDTSKVYEFFVHRAVTFFGQPFQVVKLNFSILRRSPATPHTKMYVV